MKISVIIVAYKSPDVLSRCLDSFEEHNDLGEELEIIVVDNSPEDECIEKVMYRLKSVNYRYISADNRGFGTGNNIGAKVAKGEILAFINPDIILVEPVFKEVYDKFKESKNIEMLGVRLLSENLTPGFSFYYDYKCSVLKKQMIKIWNKIGRFDSKTMYISGADMFVRKKSFFEAGMFDENIFMYYEEPDITRRLLLNNRDGYVVFDSSHNMIHLEKKSTPHTLQMLDHEFESAIYYGKKYGLDYKRKVRFEIKYLKLKKFAYRIVRGCQQSADIENQIEHIENKFHRNGL